MIKSIITGRDLLRMELSWYKLDHPPVRCAHPSCGEPICFVEREWPHPEAPGYWIHDPNCAFTPDHKPHPAEVDHPPIPRPKKIPLPRIF